MILRHLRTLSSLVSCAVLASCSAASDVKIFEPLVGAEPIASTLQRSPAPTRDTPLVELSGIMGGVEAVFQTNGGVCDIASAKASSAGSVIEIRLDVSNPPTPCSLVLMGYRYAVRVMGVAPGRYEVRFVSAYGTQPPVEMGRSSVVVLQYVLD